MISNVQEAEQALVLHIAQFAPQNWVRFVANIEIEDGCSDYVCKFIVQDQGELHEINTEDPGHGATYHHLLDPLKSLWVASDRKWKVADVVLDYTGKYSIRYGYEYARLAVPMKKEGVTVLKDYAKKFGSEIPRR
jgi:hypothetical protein